MTTSVPTRGGPALPVTNRTDHKTQGRVAISVYGFANEADAVAAGFKAQAGPAMPIYIVTAAELANGTFVQEADPKATPIYTAPAGMATEGDYATPVVVMNGWPTPPVTPVLPYSVDFSTLPDGALPSRLTGATFAISGGKAVNTPTVSGGNLLTDPGLEANYTAGLCDTLAMVGGAAVSQSADVHQGVKAQAFQSAAFNNRINFATQAATAKTWYRFSGWGKRVSGVANTTAIRLDQVNGYRRLVNSAAYFRHVVVNYMTTTANIFSWAAIETNAAGDAIIVDDFALEKLTQSTLFAVLPATQADVTLKADLTAISPSNGAPAGIVARLDSVSSPTYFAIAYIRFDGQYTVCALEEFVSGVKAILIDESAVTYVAGAWLELRLTGNQATLWYDNAQIGAAQTLNAAGTSNKIHGMFSTDSGVSVNRFFCGVTTQIEIGFAGSSNTQNGSTGYRPLAQARILQSMPQYESTFLLTALGGWSTWPNLVKLSTLTTATQVIFDQSNDSSSDTSHVEAYIRRAWANGSRVVSMVFPAWSGGTDMSNDAVISTPSNGVAMTQHKAVCVAYGVPVIDAYALFQSLVPGTYHLNQLMADTAHLTALGFQLVEALLAPYEVIGGNPGTLPARVYAASADFEQTPITKTGIQYDSRTGTWADNGTSTSSSTPDDTITFSGTFRSFGCYRADSTYPTVSVSIDGGAYIDNFAFYANGYDIGTRAAHTVTIKVATTCKIDEFWAI